MYTKIKIIIAFFVILSNALLVQWTNAQSLSPSVIASAGEYQSNNAGSLSFTIGEANTKTFTSANNMLTQGFQQPYKMTLNLKAYIQGYYAGSGLMQNVLYNQGVINTPDNQCDTIQIELHSNAAPFALVSSARQVIHTDGTVTFSGIAASGQSYYIVIKHRNAIQTWSATPVQVNENTYYDFTTSANKAYGDNQAEVEPGIFALFSGDLNSDENVDLLDIGFLENDINLFNFGYLASDLNGDGNVDLLDSPLLETNINAFIYSIHP